MSSSQPALGWGMTLARLLYEHIPRPHLDIVSVVQTVISRMLPVSPVPAPLPTPLMPPELLLSPLLLPLPPLLLSPCGSHTRSIHSLHSE